MCQVLVRVMPALIRSVPSFTVHLYKQVASRDSCSMPCNRRHNEGEDRPFCHLKAQRLDEEVYLPVLQSEH